MYPFGAGIPNTTYTQSHQISHPISPKSSYPIKMVSPNPEFPDKPEMPMPFGSGLLRDIGFNPPAPGFVNYPPSATPNFPSAISACPNFPQANSQITIPASNIYPNLRPTSLTVPDLIPNCGRPFSYTEPKMQSMIMEKCDDQSFQGTPTLLPFPNFSSVSDAAVLRKAMKGFGTDSDALISVICHRNNTQRQEIAKAFKTHYGKDLIEDVKSETRGNFEDLLVALLLPVVDFYCKELHDGMAGIGTDEDVLMEILCSLSNVEIETIKARYEQMYKRKLEDDIIGDTSGHFKRLLVSLCNAGRDESGETDLEAARADATELLRAGELKVGTDESTFNRILCQRNFQQLRLICQEYEKMTGNSLEKAIESEFSGDIKDGLIAIIQIVRDKHEFFARRLHKSMHGLGTNDRQLIRLVVARCEIDMGEIKTAFERLYGKTLKSYVKGDTSGDYKHALYALIGEQRSS